MDKKEFIKLLGHISKIKFKKHFFHKSRNRKIVSMGIVKRLLNQSSKLLHVQEQIQRDELVYKLWYKLGNKYFIIVAKFSGEVLYIITAYISERKWK